MSGMPLLGEVPVSLAWAHPLVAEWFLAKFRLADGAAGAGLAGNPGGAHHVDLGSDGIGQNAGGIPDLH